MTALAAALAFTALLAFVDQLLRRRPRKVNIEAEKLQVLEDRVGRIELAISSVRARWGQTG